MGPFKHTVDDGLDLRKAAFECMYTLLDSCLDRLDVFEFLNHVELGLKGISVFVCFPKELSRGTVIRHPV